MLLALAFGSFVLWILGPILGAAFCWASNRWTRQDKIVATCIVVAGLGLQLALLIGLFVIDWETVLPRGG